MLISGLWIEGISGLWIFGFFTCGLWILAFKLPPMLPPSEDDDDEEEEE